MATRFSFQWSTIAAIIVAILCFFYTLNRAEKLSITCDEAYSYQMFHGNPDVVHSANHHILNTYMMLALSKIFGEDKLVLRSPNLFAHLMFLFFSFLILLRLQNQWLIIIGFLVLNLNPFLLEYFSLARGYGLSIGFMTMSLWMFLKQVENYTDDPEKSNRFLYGSFICASLAVLSSFMLTYFYVGLLSIYFLLEINKSPSKKIFVTRVRKNVIFYFLNLLFLIFVYRSISVLSREHQLYFGGHTGFYSDTISSLVTNSLSEKIRHFILPVIPEHFFSVSVIILFVIAALVLINSVLIKKIKFDFSVLFYLLSFMILLPAVLWQLTGTLLPVNRTALMYYPLFILTLFFMMKELFLSQKKPVKIFSVVFSSFIGLLVIINAALSVNFKNTTEWKYDTDDENMMQTLQEDIQNRQPSGQISLGVNWVFEPSINYYRVFKKLTWLKPVTHDDYDNSSFDYFYIFSDAPFKTSSEFELDTVKIFESTLLLRKKFTHVR